MSVFKVGQTVHVHASRRSWTTATITKVGRKYVYAKQANYSQEVKYDGETGVEVTYYGSAQRIFDDAGKAEYERRAQVEQGLARHNIHRPGYGSSYSIETLEAVIRLLDADQGNDSGEVAR